MTPEIVDVAITGATRTTQAGAVTAAGSWLLSSEFGILLGAGIGVAGLVMQWYFNRRRDQREQAEHDRRMRAP